MRTIVIGCALLLAGCGGGEDAGEENVASGAGQTVAAAGGRWNPLDACATLGRDAASEASGSAVTASQLDTVVRGTDGTAALSMCTFTLANGGKLALLTRESPVADATADAIAAARTGGGHLPPATDVPGLGRAALWTAQTKQLQVFFDDRRYAAINYMGLPGGADGREQALAVARALM